jgi:hypothetical protein
MSMYRVHTKSGLTVTMKAESALAAGYAAMCAGFRVERVVPA